jgi:3',5'-cyclic AMP phosphodiesterase CpdA
LKVGGFAGLSLLAGGTATRAVAQTSATSNAGKQRVLRLAHITDVHIEPERAADEGFATCLKHIQAQKDPVDLILNTGDCIYDSTSKGAKRTDQLWTLWNDTLAKYNKHRIESAIGNHDVWGWNKAKSKTTGTEPNWGKARALAGIGLKTPYRSFDLNGWHFVVLDSIFAPKDGSKDGDKEYFYEGRLDEQQFAWLEQDLAAVKPGTPVLVMSHIPIFSITPLIAKDVTTAGKFGFGAGAIHMDGQRLKDLFEKYPNVKVAISGHQHLVDRVDYNGVSYLCNGAVSGGWWKSSNLDDCDCGYALMNLYADGSFDREYVNFGWTYQPDAKPEKTLAKTS